jgi:phage terminase large subunit GpA-like protein
MCESLKAARQPDPHKNTLSRIELDTMDVYTGWAGSPQSLGSRTCRYVRFDEVDKYPPFAGREADPISLGKERTGTYLTASATTSPARRRRARARSGGRGRVRRQAALPRSLSALRHVSALPGRR